MLRMFFCEVGLGKPSVDSSKAPASSSEGQPEAEGREVAFRSGGKKKCVDSFSQPLVFEPSNSFQLKHLDVDLDLTVRLLF